MPLHPMLQAFADRSDGQQRPSMGEMTPEQLREGYKLVAAMSGAPAELASIADRAVPGPAGEIPIRIYTPQGLAPFPVVVFFHGGGFTIGSIETHDIVCQHLAAGVEAVVVSVEYRLAPEHKFPAALDDAVAAAAWVHAHAGEVGGDADRLAVAGDSAGGNLATGVCHHARDAGGPPIRFQLLVYPTVDARMGHPSIKENAEALFLGEDTMSWFHDHYARSPEDKLDPRMSPLLAADLSGLPPALIITAEYDPLRDEGEEYGAKLRAAGVPATVSRYDGMTHAFFQLGGVLEDGQRAMQESVAALRAALHA
jgi:acetyl esterase